MPEWMKNFLDNDFKHWRGIIFSIWDDVKRMLLNPECFVYSIVAISLSSLGVWIVFYPDSWWETDLITGEAVFTFCVALIGSMAMEKFFDRDTDEREDKSYTLAVLLGFVALVSSFFAYKNVVDWKWYALVPTVVLWLFVNSRRKLFRKKEESDVKLTTNLLRGTSDAEFKGGLDHGD